MTKTMRIASLSLAVLLMASNAFAQNLSANPLDDVPGSHGGGPITGGDVPLEQPDTPQPPTFTPTEHPPKVHGGGGYGAGHNDFEADTTPTGQMSCSNFEGLPDDNGGVVNGIDFVNTGGTVINVGSIARVTMPDGSIVDFVFPTSIWPGGNWMMTGFDEGFSSSYQCDFVLILA